MVLVILLLLDVIDRWNWYFHLSLPIRIFEAGLKPLQHSDLKQAVLMAMLKYQVTGPEENRNIREEEMILIMIMIT